MGVYANDYAGDVHIVREGDRLVLQLGPKRAPYPLKHFSGDMFTYEFFLEFAGKPSMARFLIGPEGTAEAIDWEELTANGVGRLDRSLDRSP